MPPSPDPKAIESVLLGGEAVHTRKQAVELAGIDSDLAHRIWRALGFPTQSDDSVIFTESDVEALRIANSLLQEGVLDEDGVVRFARAMGQTMARLADWQTSILSTLFFKDGEEASAGPLLGRVKELLPDVERLLLHIWRRQLAASTSRTLAVMSNGQDIVPNYYPLIVGFADLVSFLEEARLDAIGVFGYSDEEGTEAAGHGDKLSQEVIDERVDRLNRLAEELMAQRAEERIGSEVTVLVESVLEDGAYEGRADHQAPDVDGSTILYGQDLEVGDLVRATVIQAAGADLVAEQDESEETDGETGSR